MNRWLWLDSEKVLRLWEPWQGDAHKFSERKPPGKRRPSQQVKSLSDYSAGSWDLDPQTSLAMKIHCTWTLYRKVVFWSSGWPSEGLHIGSLLFGNLLSSVVKARHCWQNEEGSALVNRQCHMRLYPMARKEVAFFDSADGNEELGKVGEELPWAWHFDYNQYFGLLR